MKFRFTSSLNILDKYKDTCAWNCLWMTMKYMYIYFTCIHGDYVILNKTFDFHFQVGLCTTCAILLHEVPHEVCTCTTAVSLSLFSLKELTIIMWHSIFIYITNFFFNIKSYAWELVPCQREEVVSWYYSIWCCDFWSWAVHIWRCLKTCETFWRFCSPSPKICLP